MPLRVAIVGRPNVGKSTLFNRLAGKKLALVDDTPGVTRDWRAAPARLAGLEFEIIDTAGLEEAFDQSLEARMRRQTERAIAQADVILFLVDARAGVTPLDRHFADWLRARPVPVILVANKSEGKAGAPGLYEAYELGLGDPVPLSAEHGEGMGELFDALLPYMPPDEEPEEEEGEAGAETAADEEAGEISESRPLQLAIVGRPNAGKSTLLNSLIGEERVLTGPEAGMTRDAIAVDWSWNGKPVRVVDTAGLRRRARVDEKLEKLAVADALRVIRLANVVVLVVDAGAILDRQDLTIARMVVEEGRALVLAINKWDLVEDKAAAMRQVEDKLQAQLAQARGVPVVAISALRGQRLDRLMEAVFQAYAVWNRRIPTAQLNRWLEQMLGQHPPPLVEGRRVRIRYATQVKARPPTFALWVSKPLDLPESYLRYLANGLRDAFEMPGVPIRLQPRKGKNPYADQD
ncbi:ribosome biogenesis GTPase Der [Arenibaculum pallidiluteum]|uniref:ribosome biogenesis GTPase Der n=1 Tax=Arenibaculum pallidiluteum TaxID=2812559 RepID=UPI001A95C8A6|nr:ribosome biogenesis GTPase Der [Arenibaculum pallidiluteum]